jgi:hypothetical protein
LCGVYLVPKLHYITTSLVRSSLCPWLVILRLTPYIHLSFGLISFVFALVSILGSVAIHFL